MDTPLRSFVDSWLKQIGAIRFSALPRSQDPPFASLTFGAGGIAYALLRAGQARGDRDLLLQAERWARTALGHLDEHPLQIPSGVAAGASLAYGRDGIRLVQAFIAHALGDARLTRARIGAFVRSVRATRRRPAELLFGSAGQLAGALGLLEATGDARLRALVDEHAKVLSRQAPVMPDLAFAHGRAGILHSLLRWRKVTGGALPEWFAGALEDLAREQPAWQRARKRAQFSNILGRTWCNGAAGLTLLWTAAFEETGTKKYLALARSTLRTSLGVTGPATGDLCCGLAGRAYAALAVARVLPRAGLRARAQELALAAVRQMRGSWPNGLLKGYPGVVCLAVDLLHEQRPRGFPLVES
jgi:eukaryotic-like serine/threonine-protein kinase